MEETNDLAESLARFSERSGRSYGDIALALTRLGLHPKGRTVSKTMVYNYASGITKMPGWVAEGLETLYPNWRTYSDQSERSAEGIYLPEPPYPGPEPPNDQEIDEGRLANLFPSPLLPSITEKEWLEDYEFVIKNPRYHQQVKRIRQMGTPFNLRLARTMFQEVNHRVEGEYLPMLRIGDVVWLNPSVDPRINTLHAIQLMNEDKGRYAALIDGKGGTKWQLADGSQIPAGEAIHMAAVIGILQQYIEGRMKGIFNDRGLEVPAQTPWPPIN